MSIVVKNSNENFSDKTVNEAWANKHLPKNDSVYLGWSRKESIAEEPEGVKLVENQVNAKESIADEETDKETPVQKEVNANDKGNKKVSEPKANGKKADGK